MTHRLAVILPAYVVAYMLCFYAAFQLRFDYKVPAAFELLMWQSMPVVLAIKIATCILWGEWRRTFRYATFSDALYLVGCSTSAAALITLANPRLFPALPIPGSIILIECMLSTLTLGVLRSGYRIYDEAVRPLFDKSQQQRTFVYGIDAAAMAIVRTLQAQHGEYRVVGLVDEHVTDRKSLIAGLPVFCASQGWEALRALTGAEHVLIPSSVPGKSVRRIVEESARVGLKTHIIPGVNEVVDGRFKIAVRDVTISDLLRRAPAELDAAAIRDYVQGRCVMVTGAAGSIGSELCRQVLEHEPASLVLVDHSETGIFHMQQELCALSNSHAIHFIVASIVDEAAIARIMDEHRPQLLFHAAAYKHVPLMEQNPQEAIRNNVLGTKTLVDLADRFDVERFVLISTDKAVNPSSVMGSTKLVAEKYLQAMSERSQTQFITVRFGNVLNSAGSVVPTFRSQIEVGGPLTVTHPDMVRFFMTIPEAVQLVFQAGAIGSSGDVLILEMGEPVRIVDLARDMILLSGLRCPEDIEIVFTGIRPGEKLYEELFYESEENAKRVHEKIYCATRRDVHAASVHRDIARLRAAVDVSTREAADVLHEIVADFVAAETTPVLQNLKSAA